MDTNTAHVTNAPLYIEWRAPTDGAVVSNTIHLSVNAVSSKAPIERIVWYRDGVPFMTNYYNTNFAPSNVIAGPFKPR